MQDPKKYAEELVEKMRLSSLKMSKKDAVNCASVSVQNTIDYIQGFGSGMSTYIQELEKVKSELEKK